MSVVVVTDHEGWSELRINRADKRNALNQAARQELREALRAKEGVAKAIVISGSEEWFCCGADIKERAARLAQGLPDATAEEGIELAMAIRDFPGVVIASVNGLALGYGVNLINCADLAVASDRARLGLPELRSASFASVSSATTQLAGVSRKRLAWLIYDADPIDAATAREWGLVNLVVSAGELQPRIATLANKIAGFDAAAIAETKAALAKVPDASDWRAAMQMGQGVRARIDAHRARQTD
jgi:enoyl-CoA hydratase/carnithine racemase